MRISNGIACLAAVLGTVVALAASVSAQPQAPNQPAPTSGIEFIANRGQWDTTARFVGNFAGGLVRAEPNAIGLQLPSADGGAYSRLSFEGANARAIEGDRQRASLRHYFIGNDPAKWVRDVPVFESVRWRELYPGIDLVLRTNEGALKYDLHVAAGAELARVRVRCEGVVGILVDPENGVLIETPAGPVEQPLGRCWQTLPSGEERDTAIRVRDLGDNTFGFELVGHDPSLPAVIDPGLLWSTYFGSPDAGFTGDWAKSAACDAQGDVYVTGECEWPGFPTTPGAYQHPSGFSPTLHMFVAKFKGTTGALVYSSVMGCQGYDRPQRVVVDSSGRALVAGYAEAGDFPTTPGSFDPVKNGFGHSGFVLRLSAAGDDLEFSTFIEGQVAGGTCNALALAPSGKIIVGGEAHSADFPTTPGAFDTSFNSTGYADAFVLRLDSTGSTLEWSTLLGGNTGGDDGVLGVAALPNGDVVLAGYSGLFPTTPGAFDTTHNGQGDAVVARLRGDGAALLWSTFLGGGAQDAPTAVGVLPCGDVVVAGWTRSGNFPTTPGAFQTQSQIHSGAPWDGFVTRLNAVGSALVYSSYFGGRGNEAVQSFEMDSSGVVTITGGSASDDLPMTRGSFQTQWAGSADCFLTRIHPLGQRLLYSSYIGGPGSDGASGVAVAPNGRMTIAGSSNGGYPITPGGASYAGGQLDAIITALDPVLEGVEFAEPSVPSCFGSLHLNAEPKPVAGSPVLRLYCSQAPPDAAGVLAIWLPIPAGTSWPVRPSDRIAVRADADGWVETPFALTTLLAGAQLRFRYIFRNTPSCGGIGSLAFSNGLLVTVQ